MELLWTPVLRCVAESLEERDAVPPETLELWDAGRSMTPLVRLAREEELLEALVLRERAELLADERETELREPIPMPS